MSQAIDIAKDILAMRDKIASLERDRAAALRLASKLLALCAPGVRHLITEQARGAQCVAWIHPHSGVTDALRHFASYEVDRAKLFFAAIAEAEGREVTP